jgi:acyl carrier protein
MSVDRATVLAEMTEMLHTILDDDGLDDVEIGMDTTFHEDLALESVDLVTLAGLLAERYGDEVNFAEFVAGQDLDTIIALRVGQLVDFVVAALAPAEAGAA